MNVKIKGCCLVNLNTNKPNNGRLYVELFLIISNILMILGLFEVKMDIILWLCLIFWILQIVLIGLNYVSKSIYNNRIVMLITHSMRYDPVMPKPKSIDTIIKHKTRFSTLRNYVIDSETNSKLSSLTYPLRQSFRFFTLRIAFVSFFLVVGIVLILFSSNPLASIYLNEFWILPAVFIGRYGVITVFILILSYFDINEAIQEDDRVYLVLTSVVLNKKNKPEELITGLYEHMHNIYKVVRFDFE